MPAGAGGAGPRLLIVEDEQALANAMARTLRSRGFQADIALSGAEARERFAAVDYALVLMGIRLPDGSGDGLLEELHKKRPAAAAGGDFGGADADAGPGAGRAG